MYPGRWAPSMGLSTRCCGFPVRCATMGWILGRILAPSYQRGKSSKYHRLVRGAGVGCAPGGSDQEVLPSGPISLSRAIPWLFSVTPSRVPSRSASPLRPLQSWWFITVRSRVCSSRSAGAPASSRHGSSPLQGRSYSPPSPDATSHLDMTTWPWTLQSSSPFSLQPLLDSAESEMVTFR